MPFSQERRQDQPEALLSYIEKRIKQAVVSGELKPGAKLSPSAIAADLGVSHIPVREALTSLAASGYLEHKPRVGFFVRVLSADDLADIYHWREVLEREALTMAIPLLTSQDIEEMRRLCNQMRRLIAPGTRSEFLDLNHQFHFVAFRRAGSDQLLRFLSYLWDFAESHSLSGLGNIEKAQRDHEQMMDLFEARDVDGIIEAMARHRGLAAWPGPARSLAVTRCVLEVLRAFRFVSLSGPGPAVTVSPGPTTSSFPVPSVLRYRVIRGAAVSDNAARGKAPDRVVPAKIDITNAGVGP